jgi:hypothetical protein
MGNFVRERLLNSKLVQACGGEGTGEIHHLTTERNHIQSSICNPGTRANSLVLLVTKVAPKVSA